MLCRIGEDGTCAVHGAEWIRGRAFSSDFNGCSTKQVLEDVGEERERQFACYGTNSDNADGTGQNVRWAWPVGDAKATEIENLFRNEYNLAPGEPTWMQLVREEVAEAFMESDPDRLEEELIQVAALAVSWVEKLRARQRKLF